MNDTANTSIIGIKVTIIKYSKLLACIRLLCVKRTIITSISNGQSEIKTPVYFDFENQREN